MPIATRTHHWRIAAICGLLALVASIVSPSFIQTAEAHTGTPGTLCGSVDLITAYYAGQYNAGDGAHYHRWDPIGPEGVFDWQCGYGAGSG
jgi:hypothetical protein